jgi:hypothetical protein
MRITDFMDGGEALVEMGSPSVWGNLREEEIRECSGCAVCFSFREHGKR